MLTPALVKIDKPNWPLLKGADYLGIVLMATHAAGFIGGDFQKQVVAQTPLGRIGRPDDIGKVAAFLASDDSGWLTGERFVASGGF